MVENALFVVKRHADSVLHILSLSDFCRALVGIAPAGIQGATILIPTYNGYWAVGRVESTGQWGEDGVYRHFTTIHDIIATKALPMNHDSMFLTYNIEAQTTKLSLTPAADPGFIVWPISRHPVGFMREHVPELTGAMNG